MKAKIVNSVDDVCNFYQQVWGLSKNQTISLKANVQKLVLNSTATAEADLAKAREEMQKLMAALEISNNSGGHCLDEQCKLKVADALTTARNYLEGK